MDALVKLEALGVAMLDVIRDSQYDEEVRVALRAAYDVLEDSVCRMQTQFAQSDITHPRT